MPKPNSNGRESVESFASVASFSERARQMPIPWTVESCNNQFSARIEKSSASGRVHFASISFDPCRCERSGTDAGPEDDHYFCLTAQRQGNQQMIWDSRKEVLAPHDLILWDEREDMILQNGDCSSAFNLWLPSERIRRRVGDFSVFVGSKLCATAPEARMLDPFLRRLQLEFDNLVPSTRDMLVDATIELIFSCFHPQKDVEECDTRKGRLIDEAEKWISNTNDIAELTPDAVATYLGISKRYLQQLFNERGQTFSSRVARERLNRAYQALNNPRFDKCSMTEIALRSGFFDSSHFNRSFKRLYGMTPMQFRRQR